MSQRVSPLGTETYAYDQYNRLVDQKLDGTTYAHITYNAFSQIDNVTYPAAGSLKLQLARDTLGRTSSNTYTLGNGTTQVADTVTRAVTGDIITDVVTSGSQQLNYGYSYDTAGRLVGATAGPHTYSYGFGAASSSCNGMAGNNPNAGKDSNRTTQTVDGVTTTFCYDQADRLIGSSDTLYNGGDYDTHGNMTSVGTGTAPLRLCYDSSDRNTCMTQRNDSGNGMATYYTRDVQGRIAYRENDAIANWNWTLSNNYWYGFTGSGDTPDFVRDASWNVIEKILQLPGDVLATIKPTQTGNAQKQYSLPNIHGDTLLTADAAGTNTSTGNGPASSFTYDPFGNILTGSTLPSNVSGSGSYGYVGTNQKITEAAYTLTPIQMGARVYIPGLGRFLQVDSVQGGTANNYVYVLDPVNDFDLSGQFGWKAFATITSVGSIIPGPIGMAFAAVSAASYAAAGDRKNAIIMTVAIAASAVGGGLATKAAAKAVDKAASMGQTASLAARVVERGGAVAARAQSKLPAIGARSKLFGNVNQGAKAPGALNNYGKIKIGWSSFPANRQTFRVGFKALGKNRHIDLIVGRRW